MLGSRQAPLRKSSCCTKRIFGLKKCIQASSKTFLAPADHIENLRIHPQIGLPAAPRRVYQPSAQRVGIESPSLRQRTFANSPEPRSRRVNPQGFRRFASSDPTSETLVREKFGLRSASVSFGPNLSPIRIERNLIAFSMA